MCSNSLSNGGDASGRYETPYKPIPVISPQEYPLYLIPESRELKDSMPPCTLYSVVTVKDAAAEGKR